MNWINTLVTAETTMETMAETVAENENAANMIKEMIANTDPARFAETMKYMGIGMLGIFLVMGILILGTALLNKITSRTPKDGE